MSKKSEPAVLDALLQIRDLTNELIKRVKDETALKTSGPKTQPKEKQGQCPPGRKPKKKV